MKKSIIVLTLLTASAAVQAEHKWLFTTPELLINVGGSVGEENEAYSVKFSVQETLCYTAKHFCINPSVMWLTVDDPNAVDSADKLNIGAGVDIKYKFPKTSNNGIYVEAGPVGFVKDLNEDRIKLHVGTGVEYNRFIVSVDSYGTSDNFYMLSVGYRL